MPDHNGEWKGATTAQIEFLKDAIREQREALRDIAATLDDLRDFKAKMMAYAGMAAAAASLLASWILDNVGGP